MDEVTHSLLFGTRRGILKYERNTLSPLRLLDNQTRLDTSLVNTLFRDTKGTLWVGLTKRVAAFFPSSKTLLFYEHDPRDPTSMPKGAVLMYAMFRSLATAQLPLSALIGRANRIFCEGTLTAHYASLISGSAHVDGRIELCNAGHPPAFVLGREGVRSIHSTATPIGLFSSVDFPTLHLHRASGERLVAYSDGVTEAQNAVGEQFGEERLRASLVRHSALSPQELIEACLDEVGAFRRGRPRDGVTMFVLERR
ncbi:MAG: hypothetical protein C4326_01565 [Ignavibacteria bacterium]